MSDNMVRIMVDRMPAYPIDCPFSKHIAKYGIACTLRYDTHCSLKYAGSCECLTTAEKIEEETKAKQEIQELIAKCEVEKYIDEIIGATPGLLESED